MNEKSVQQLLYVVGYRLTGEVGGKVVPAVGVGLAEGLRDSHVVDVRQLENALDQHELLSAQVVHGQRAQGRVCQVVQ